MPLPIAVARFSHRYLNPLVLRWAARMPGYCVLEHAGRRSGRRYRTPLVAFRTSDGVAFLPSYWPRCDWARNVLAAGGGELIRRGRRTRLTAPRMLTGAEAAAVLPRVVRLGARVMRVDAVLVATEAC